MKIILMFISTILCLTTYSSSVLASPIKLSKKVIPASVEHPAGMKTVISEADGYAATYVRDVVYATHGTRELKLNILMPMTNPFAPKTDKPENLRPLIVYVQGSGWLPQNLTTAIPQLADFAQRGYVVASVEYRHSLEAKSPAQLIDVKAAIRFMRAKSKKYMIDPERVGVWGDSSGGHLSALVGATGDNKTFTSEDNSDHSDTVEAVVDFYGPTNLKAMSNYPSKIDHDDARSPESTVIGGPIQDPKFADKVKEYNPMTYISKDKRLPPYLIMHGDVDALVPFNQSVLLYEALQAAGQNATFYRVKGGDHGIRFWTPSVLRIVHDFFDKHLK